QAFMHGSDTVALLEWDLASALPASVTIKNYTDLAMTSYPTDLQLRQYMTLAMDPGAYTYSIKYYYRTPLLGNIVNEQDLIGAKLSNNSWMYYNGASTTLDTVKNTFKLSFMSDNNFKLAGTDNLAPLPVEFTYLTAENDNGNVNLNWETASETNNIGFEVERSFDSRTFKNIGFVNGAGNSNRSLAYQFNDLNPFTTASTVYYRLRQVDRNGKFTYSQVVKVSESAETINALSVYPNPFKTSYTVSFNALTEGIATLEMTDIQGRIVSSQTSAVTLGTNIVPMNKISSLEIGVYFVRLTKDGETTVTKLVKN
ncbi:MAG: T9SS type A sorting domain-containing protein, partial [Bacteroidota bacterium]